uniref:Uncharacterized protein n=1 Tax=Panagrolaimus sp. JU765 TaxID=591449 RepID=A0AC34QFN4_9BILA
MSATKFKLQYSLFVALSLQFAIPFIFGVIPIVIVTVLVQLHFENITFICLLLLCSGMIHTVLSNLTNIFIVRPYREAAIYYFSQKKNDKEKRDSKKSGKSEMKDAPKSIQQKSVAKTNKGKPEETSKASSAKSKMKSNNQEKDKDESGKQLPGDKSGYDNLNPDSKMGKVGSKMESVMNAPKKNKHDKDNDKDGGYDEVDPTKNVNRENVVLHPDEKTHDKPSVEKKEKKKKSKKDKETPEKPKPRQMPKDEKQKKIDAGAKKGKGEYPTMDDVLSDWDSKKDKKESKKETKRDSSTKSKNVDNIIIPVVTDKKDETRTEGGSEKEEKFVLKSQVKTVTEKTQQLEVR